MEVYGVVYLLIDGTNDKEYVGQTTKTVEERFNQHKRGDLYIDRAIRKRGADMFDIAILKVCYSQEELDYWERHMIRSRDTKSPNGYNMTDGGDNDFSMSAETCAKMSASHMGKKRPVEFVLKFAAIRRADSPYKNLINELDERKITYTVLVKLLRLANFSYKIRGKRHFTTKDVAKLVEIFGKPAEYLLEREDGLSLLATLTNRGKTPFKNLADAMSERQLSHTELAKLMDSTQRSVSRKIHGDRNFNVKEVAKLVEIFGKPAEYLMARDDGLPATTSKAAMRSKLSVHNRGETPYKNLLEELDKQQLSYTALAKLIGLSHQMVSEKMRGEYSFSAKDIAKLVEIFGKPAEYLMQRDEL